MKSVVMYFKPYCPYCHRAERLLNQKGVSIESINIAEFPERRAEMIERAHGRSTVPQIFINNQHIGGCDDLYELERQGKLDALLADEA